MGPVNCCYTRYANDRMNQVEDNCRVELRNGRAALVAIEDIFPGDELTYSYGRDYWVENYKCLSKSARQRVCDYWLIKGNCLWKGETPKLLLTHNTLQLNSRKSTTLDQTTKSKRNSDRMRSTVAQQPISTIEGQVCQHGAAYLDLYLARCQGVVARQTISITAGQVLRHWAACLDFYLARCQGVVVEKTISSIRGQGCRYRAAYRDPSPARCHGVVAQQSILNIVGQVWRHGAACLDVYPACCLDAVWQHPISSVEGQVWRHWAACLDLYQRAAKVWWRDQQS